MYLYKAVSFDKLISAGGSTYPWVVRVLTEGGKLTPYVVKLFQEHLRYVNVNVIAQAANELQGVGVSVGRVDLITDYLSQTKTRHAEFTQLLQTLIA